MITVNIRHHSAHLPSGCHGRWRNKTFFKNKKKGLCRKAKSQILMPQAARLMSFLPKYILKRFCIHDLNRWRRIRDDPLFIQLFQFSV